MLRATAEAFRSYADERSLLDAQSIVEQVGGETGSQVVVVGGATGSVLANQPALPGTSYFGESSGDSAAGGGTAFGGAAGEAGGSIPRAGKCEHVKHVPVETVGVTNILAVFAPAVPPGAAAV